MHPVIFHLVSVLHLFIVYCSQHLVPLSCSVCFLKIFLISFHLNCFAELCIITLPISLFLHSLYLHIALISLCLTLDNSTPLIQVTLWISWVVAFLISIKVLYFLTLLLHWLLYSCRMHFKRVHDCIAAHFSLNGLFLIIAVTVLFYSILIKTNLGFRGFGVLGFW